MTTYTMNHDLSLEKTKKAAEQGDADAQYELARMYECGQGASQNDQQAVLWYRGAAEQGHINAQYMLGRMYIQGLGVPQDYAQAVSWYRKAAAQGSAIAQNNLGLVYGSGLGVPQDSIVAYALFNLSATEDPSSDNSATNNRGTLAARMPPEQIAAGQELSRRMMKVGVLEAIDSLMW